MENPYDILVLVNQNSKLSEDFSPSDLALPDVLNIYSQSNWTIYVREEIVMETEELFQAAKDEANLTLWLRSGYRSYSDQYFIYQRVVDQHGQAEADRISMRAGHSEHQTGLAIDVTAHSVGGHLTQDFSDTPEGNWVANNAHRFGFIVRYLEGREDDLGITYEPWHLRYVGRQSATYIFENQLILEEYLLSR